MTILRALKGDRAPVFASKRPASPREVYGLGRSSGPGESDSDVIIRVARG